MWTFAVWAPAARTVAVRLGDSDYPLSSGSGGWWSGELAEAAPGADYWFVFDGGPPTPDPRSAWQPTGVHGPSRVVDQAAFPWTDSAWRPRPLVDAVIYELHVGTFTPAGTFDSAREKLAYLRELGVTHVELLPVNEFSGDWGWGYDGVDLYAPHHAYGGPDGLKRLVDACHNAGLAVILDVVYNHLGPTGNYLARFGPYFTDRHKTPWGDALNLDGPGSHEVRRFFCDNALQWLRDYHIDGLRLDAVHALIDKSETHFLAQLAREVKALGSHKILIAESDWNDPVVVRDADQGYGLDAQWSDDFHHALHAALTGETGGYYMDFGGLQPLAKALRDRFVYDGAFSAHRGRPHGAPAGDVPPYRFLGYAQTHDQVGNRAQGERLAHLTNLGRVKIAAALVLLSPFTPMLFQGEEFAASAPFLYFTQHAEEELARAVSEGRKREYGSDAWNIDEVPDPQDPGTFTRSKLDWNEIDREPHAEVLAWHRALIRLRSTFPGLQGEKPSAVGVDYQDGGAGAPWIRVTRGNLQVLANLAADPQALVFPAGAAVLLASHPNARFEQDRAVLPGDSVIVINATSATQASKRETTDIASKDFTKSE